MGTKVLGKRTKSEMSLPNSWDAHNEPGSEPPAKRSRHHAKETCARFPDLSTAAGQDAFFNIVGVAGIEACFRNDLKNVEGVYWNKLSEHAQARTPPRRDESPTQTSTPYFESLKTTPVPADGDCFFTSLAVAANKSGASQAPLTPTQIRRDMAAHLIDEFSGLHDADEPAPYRAGVDACGDLPDVRSNWPQPKLVATVGSTRAQHYQQLSAEQQKQVCLILQPGSWNHPLGDMYHAVASATYNVHVEITAPYTRQAETAQGKPHWHLKWKCGHYEPVDD